MKLDLFSLQAAWRRTQPDAWTRRRFLQTASAATLAALAGAAPRSLRAASPTPRLHDGEPHANGSLRRSVPEWLRMPDLRSVVMGFEEAAPHQGGSGALYVRLRRRKGEA